LPILLILLGAALLLSNFLLIEGVDLARYWPVLLIAAGLVILRRGDISLSSQSQPFGITRGNVQTAQLEVSAGELDMRVRPLTREGRLIAGQYTARSRPSLTVNGTNARLTMQRGQSWLLSMADWEIELAPDLPWTILLSSFLGAIDAAFESLTIDRAFIGTGFGDIRLSTPASAVNGVLARSTFGDITAETTPGVAALFRVEPTPFARLKVDETRYLMVEPGVYATLDYKDAAALVSIQLRTTFGTVTLR
jgi:hypothetical protein